MEQIIQLKTMRDEALVRLQNNPDYKLVNSLDALIQDLETVLLPAVQTSSVELDGVAAEDIQTSAAETDTASADEGISEERAEINEQIEELASESPDDASSAIEALEAELSQTVSGIDDDASKSETTFN